MAGAPSTVEPKQLRELHLKLTHRERELPLGPRNRCGAAKSDPFTLTPRSIRRLVGPFSRSYDPYPPAAMRKIHGPRRRAESLFGNYDENLKHLEALFNVRSTHQRHEVIVEGEPPTSRAPNACSISWRRLMRGGYKLGEGRREDRRAARRAGRDRRARRLLPARRAARTSGKRQVLPKSVNQRRYLDAIEQHDIVFGIGPAGTGKTYLAMAQAVSFLLAKQVSRIILARPAVEAGRSSGSCPATCRRRSTPILRPLYDALYDMLDVERAERLIERGTIEVAPIAFMRGRTLNDAFVILDEAQNTTSEQMKMFLTRLGFGSKAVITGDITQIDLPTGRPSGLSRR